MTDNWYINNNSKEEIDKNLQTLKATNRRVDKETGPIKERVTHIEDKRKDLIKERSTIESVRDIINEDKERGKIRKCMVKETLEKFERQNGEKKEVIRRKLDIKDEIEKVNNSNNSQKEMDHVKKEKELKSTNPLKVNKRIRKQKDIIMKLIDNFPNQLNDKKDYLIKLKDSIDIPIACIKCRKYGHHITECGKKEKEKEKKEKKKTNKIG